MGNQSKKKRKKDILDLKDAEKIDRVMAWIFIVAVALLPLIVRVKLIEFVSPKIIHELVDTGLKADIFTYYKWLFLLCLTAIAVGLLVFKMVVYRFELRSSYINVPILVLASFTILSAILSDFPGISMIGMYNRHEGALTYLCYFSLVFVAANTSFKDWSRQHIMTALYILVSVNLVIILFDFYGKDILNNPAVRSLIVPSYLPQTGMQGHLSSTLSNPNYVSGFSASLAAFFLAAALMEKSWSRRIINSIFAVLSFVMILASLSSSGFVTLAVLLPIILSLSLLNRQRIQSVATGVAVLAAFSAVLMLLSTQNPRVWNESAGIFKEFSNVIKISVNRDAERLSFFQLIKPSEAAPAGNTQASTSININPDDEFNLPKPSVGPGTGRIYIWEKTLNLIKQRPLFGHGHDTLTFSFPQNDRDKIANLGSYNTIVDKPHNFYLNIAYSSGIIAFLALAVLIMSHLYHSVRYLLKAPDGNNPLVLPAALLAFLCAFLIQWVFNDSVIGTSIIFWTLFGVSVSINNWMEITSDK